MGRPSATRSLTPGGRWWNRRGRLEALHAVRGAEAGRAVPALASIAERRAAAAVAAGGHVEQVLLVLVREFAGVTAVVTGERVHRRDERRRLARAADLRHVALEDDQQTAVARVGRTRDVTGRVGLAACLDQA